MEHTDHISQDEGLRGNEKIEEAIAALQQELSADMLAHTLTVVRRRMQGARTVYTGTGDTWS